MKRAVVSVAQGSWYATGQDRLAESLRRVGYDGDRRFWRDSIPIGSPSHAQVPYAFKAHALRSAAETHDSLLWLDASMWALKPIDPIFEHVERHGVAVWLAGWTVGRWCNDPALRKLELTRAEADTIPLVAGGIVGVCVKHPVGREFLDRFCAYAADGVTFCGGWDDHRHDMPVLSTLALRLGVEPIKAPLWWAYDANPPAVNGDETLIVCRGM